MPSAWQLRVLQFRERVRERGLADTCLFALYRSETAVPVEKDLAALRPIPGPPLPGLRLVEVAAGSAAPGLAHRDASRAARAERYFRRGYRNVVLARGGEAIGDVWYVGPRTARTREIHRHLGWFGIELGPDDVYLFDMHLTAAERGGGLATRFMSSVLHHLRDGGARRAFGYFDARNTPALWVHRLIGFRELPRVVIRKVLVFETAAPAGRRIGRGPPLPGPLPPQGGGRGKFVTSAGPPDAARPGAAGYRAAGEPRP